LSNLYLRFLGRQELGYSATGESGQRGSYFLVSKAATEFFPPLSDAITNDQVYIEIHFQDKIILCNYVYHNDKITENKSNAEMSIEYISMVQ
jgi:hypothetical protein